MTEAVIALGSNVGEREANLRRAIEELQREVTLTDVSPVYETEPMYREDQPLFLNCVVAAQTDLKPRELLGLLHSIEAAMGRRPTVRYGPRVIDLDILFYGGETVSEPGLEIPHPGIGERPFVLFPLSDIRPGLVHPTLNASASELLRRLKTDKRVVKRPELLADLVSSKAPRRS